MTARLRPMTEEEFAEYRPAAEHGYALDMEQNAGLPPDEAREKAAKDFESLLPNGLASAGQWLYVVENDGEVVGSLWVSERGAGGAPKLFVYDVEIAEPFRGRGLGRAAMLLCEDEARRRGIGRVELNVFGGNEVARNLYRSLGYREMFVCMGKNV